MAPKRKRPAPDPEPLQADTSLVANTTGHASHTTTTTTASTASTGDATSTAPAFLNTTFSTHRLSPLHIGAATPLTHARLHALGQTLRDLLVGDVARGVELGLPPTAQDARTGALELVSLGWVRLEELLGRYVGGGGGGEDDMDTSLESVESGADRAPSLLPPGKRRALQVSLQYENGEYAAILLPAVGGRSHVRSEDDEDEDEDEAIGASVEGDADFVHLPLLLLRMPAGLKAVMCGFLSRTFDCRISGLRLGTRSLVGALERWLEQGSRVPQGGVMARDVMVTLGFHAPGVLQGQQQSTGALDHDGTEAAAAEEDEEGGKTTETRSMGIKSIDVTVPIADLRRFVQAGQAHEAHRAATPGTPVRDAYPPGHRRHLGGDRDEESWSWRFPRGPRSDDRQHRQPFTEALAAYLRQHLALDLFHPAVRVTRAACGGFVLSESRVKLFGVPPAGDDGGDGARRDALSDGLQRAVWAVFGGLVERAGVRPVVKTMEAAARNTYVGET